MPAEQKKAASKKAESDSARPAASKKTHAETADDKRLDQKAKIKQALTLITGGSSVRKACEEAGIPKTTFLENVDGDQYARARDAQADVHFDEMSDYEQQCLDGDLDPQVLRSVIDSRKWRLSKMRPKVYGDKSHLEVFGKDGGPLQIADLSAMSDEQLQQLLLLGRGDDDA